MGLHYNFFRYYESDAVPFVNQDPILINPKELKWILDQIGTDPHAFKGDYVGKRAVSHYDVYKQNKTGELLLRRKNFSEFIRTGIGCGDDLPPPTAPAKNVHQHKQKNNLIIKIIGILLVLQLLLL